jgi:hypothetical protein
MGVLGLDSQFHETFGVYADGLSIHPGTELARVALELNDRPRNILAWDTPAADSLPSSQTPCSDDPQNSPSFW